MNKSYIRGWLLLLLGTFVLTGCQQGPVSCPSYSYLVLDQPESFAADPDLPFQFPLDDPESYTQPIETNFAVCGRVSETRHECHAAEDYLGDPGTPVYAMADGEISYSGTMGGYGWLVIIDHPQIDIYSLYGHLSPSRWSAEPGPVEKGELIGYLGDPDENGGSAENPLIPHLHFAIRTGQRNDYPGRGEWRWMAGWIAICPQETGWLQPSKLIAAQQIPEGGFEKPSGNFFAIWWFPLTFGAIYVFGWVFLLIYATAKDKPHLLVTFAVLYVAMGIYFYLKTPYLSIVLLIIAAISVGIGTYRLIKRRKQQA